MKREDFILKKIKLTQSGVEAEYCTLENTETYVSEKRTQNPHPDLNRSLQHLTLFVAQATHLDALHQLKGFIATEGKTKDLKGVLASAETKQKEIFDSIDVRAITLKGTEDSKSVIISSVLSCKGKATSLNTPKISLTADVYGNEVALAESIDDVIAEAWEYLFNFKTSQMRMFEGEGVEEN